MEKHLKCLRCGYKWIKRVNSIPKQCPYCKSPKWNIPKLLKYSSQSTSKTPLSDVGREEIEK